MSLEQSCGGKEVHLVLLSAPLCFLSLQEETLVSTSMNSDFFSGVILH